MLRGERKWLRHICADYWVKGRTQALHPEGSKECPSSTNSGGKKLISSSTFIHQVDFRDEGAFSSDFFVSEVFDHDILGTRLEQFHDSARLPVSPFVRVSFNQSVSALRAFRGGTVLRFQVFSIHIAPWL